MQNHFSVGAALIYVAADYLALGSLSLLRRFILEGALIKFVVVHGLLLYAHLVLKQQIDQGLAVDQGERSGTHLESGVLGTLPVIPGRDDRPFLSLELVERPSQHVEHGALDVRRCRFTWITSLIVVIPNWATAFTSTPLSLEG